MKTEYKTTLTSLYILSSVFQDYQHANKGKTKLIDGRSIIRHSLLISDAPENQLTTAARPPE